MDRRSEIRNKALKDLQESEVLMIQGHFDYGNGYHGRVYLNPHQLFRHPSTIWRFAQDLLDLLPSELVQRTELVAGPVTGGALLAHTIAGLLDSRRSLTHPPCLFAPFNYDPADVSGVEANLRGATFLNNGWSFLAALVVTGIVSSQGAKAPLVRHHRVVPRRQTFGQ